MSENDLGKALLRGEENIDIQALTRKILRRDRRRIWITGFLCVIAWMLVVMLPWATILPMMAKVVERQTQFNEGTSLTAEQRQASIEMLQAVKVGTIATFAGSVGSMFVASVLTVWFVSVSRRATLRQVNARLSDLSAQLKAFVAAKE